MAYLKLSAVMYSKMHNQQTEKNVANTMKVSILLRRLLLPPLTCTFRSKACHFEDLLCSRVCSTPIIVFKAIYSNMQQHVFSGFFSLAVDRLKWVIIPEHTDFHYRKYA